MKQIWIEKVQALNTKGLIDTVAMNKNKGLWITVKGLIDTVTMNDSVSWWKTKLKQNPNPNVAADTDYMMVGECITP